MGASTTTSTSMTVDDFIRAVIVNGTFEFFKFAFFLDNTVMKLALVDGHVNVIDMTFFNGTASVIQRLFRWTVLTLDRASSAIQNVLCDGGAAIIEVRVTYCEVNE